MIPFEALKGTGFKRLTEAVDKGENRYKQTNKARITKKSQKNGNYVGSLAVKRVASPCGMLTIYNLS